MARFNRRVLEEAQDPFTPIIEKLKFASIFSSNLDEYFMVRVGSLFRALEADIDDRCQRQEIRQQLDEIAEGVGGLFQSNTNASWRKCYPDSKKQGYSIHRIDELDEKERPALEKYFESQVFPILTPLAFDAGHPFPFLSNLRLNLMVVFKKQAQQTPAAPRLC